MLVVLRQDSRALSFPLSFYLLFYDTADDASMERI